MTRSIAFRLILSFLAVSLAGTALVAVLTGRLTASEFGRFVVREGQATLVTDLQDYYQTRHTWDGVETVVGGPGYGPGGMGAMHAGMMGGPYAVADDNGVIVVAGAGHSRGERLTAAESAAGLPLTVDGAPAGALFVGPAGPGMEMMTPAGAIFLSQVNRVLLLASLGATGLALALGVLLARALTRPVRELTLAVQAVARGRLEQRVPVRAQDELGALAAAFNQMSADLARARDLRRQMTADIAHDLRTPLSVILGHAEALRDGVLPPTPETLALVHDEAERLNRLVEDLRTLSLAEAGELALNRRLIQPGELLQRAAAAQQPRARQQEIELAVDAAPDLPEINADPDRLAQVFGNLLDNALRHTPRGGRIGCRAAYADGGAVTFSVTDTGPGIAAEDLPHLFERLYRADKARTREGGSGLGLAIAKSIVEGHGGKIWAASPPGAGAQFFIELPAG